jgi:protease I
MSKKIAILATNGFEHSELTGPKAALEQAGHETVVVSPESGSIEAAHDAGSVAVNNLIAEVRPEEFDGLVLPGGVVNPDTLRINEDALNFIQHFVDKKKPIAAICHGPWTLIETKAVAGHTMTSWPSLKTDLENAGATWVDEAVVTSENLVTSRKPADIPAFNEALLQLLN